MNLESVVDCIGSIPYEELLTYYKRCNGLLFPSKLESFGLPLVEAAIFGVPVIAADLPYAREVLEGYEGVQFANCDSVEIWSSKLIELLSTKIINSPLIQKYENSWSEFVKCLN